MVRPVSCRGFQKGFQRGFKSILELCVCIKILNLGEPKLLDSIQPHDWVTGQKAA